MHNTPHWQWGIGRCYRLAAPSFLVLLGAVACGRAVSQVAPPDVQISRAVLPAPESMRDGAAVLGYDPSGKLVTLRRGTNQLICLADRPDDDRFQVACYHKDLEPFMARGRELRAQGKSGGEVLETRNAEIEAGKLAMPSHPCTLYVYSASAPDEPGHTRYVVYVPYATVDELGLPASPTGGSPWLMMPGMPNAHIMISG